ncbi:MAG: FeoA family protein [bacterium]
MRQLIDIPAGTHVKIQKIYGGLGFRQRMAEMGLISGATIKVVKNDSHGPVIVNVNNTRIALGRGMCGKITVR